MTELNLEVRAYKSLPATDEGEPYVCRLDLEGKPLVVVTYDGHDGPVGLRWLDEAGKKKLEAYISSLPPKDEQGYPQPLDTRLLLALEVAKYQALEVRNRALKHCLQVMVNSLPEEPGVSYEWLGFYFDP